MLTKMRTSEEIIFELLLISNNRTTEFLEIITNENLYPVILKQQNTTHAFNYRVQDEAQKRKEVLLRESCLYTKDTQRIVSLNSGYICKEYVPSEFYMEILNKEKGIGTLMAEMKLSSSRNVLQKGWRNSNKLLDLCGMPLPNEFGINDILVPFKEYEMVFAGYSHPGIYLIEYFNPKIVCF